MCLYRQRESCEGELLPEFIMPLVYSSGELLRPLAPGVPLPSSFFADALVGRDEYKVIAPMTRTSAAVVAYNMSSKYPEKGWSVVGLEGKYLSTVAVKSTKSTKSTVEIELHEAGDIVVYSKRAIKSADGATIEPIGGGMYRVRGAKAKVILRR